MDGGKVGDRGRWRPVLALLVLAPWAAECSWGGFTAADVPLVVVFLGPMYGGAAVLIRETVRRAGGGWPMLALLAAAFGVAQAGLVDQSLFNRGFLDDTQYADLAGDAATTLVPGLGFSAGQAFDFVGNHVWLSICAPVMLVEAFLSPARRHRPWLGRRGLAGIGVLYVLGSLLIFSDPDGRKGFLAGPLQLGFAVAVVLALVAAARAPRWRRPGPRRPGRVPHPLLLGGLMVAAHLGSSTVPGWWGVGVRAGLAAMVAAAVVAWARRPGWGRRHVVAGWSAGLVAAAATAYAAPTYAPASPAAALAGDVAVSVVTLALVLGAYRRARAEDAAAGPPVTPPPAPGAPPAPGWSAPAW